MLQTPRKASGPRRAYSLIEMMMTLAIIQIVSGLVVVNISATNAAMKLDRAATEVISAVRYARMTAMASGRAAGVEFDTSAQQIRCYSGPSYTTVASNLFGGNQYLINLAAQTDISGVTITSVSNAGSTNPYRVSFGVLGSRADAATNNLPDYVTISYGSYSKVVAIPAVGEPYLP